VTRSESHICTSRYESTVGPLQQKTEANLTNLDEFHISTSPELHRRERATVGGTTVAQERQLASLADVVHPSEKNCNGSRDSGTELILI
jgi:hypothetical protein